ncbi:MAG: hypothetical protein ACK532_12160, partial [Acidobacteriota bacterium]
LSDFMNKFIRGKRDSQSSSQEGSTLQQLNFMNNSFVTSRAKVAASSILRAIALQSNARAITEELFIRFLGRLPSDSERSLAEAFISRAGSVQTARNTAVEDLAWVLMNKQEFIFSY